MSKPDHAPGHVPNAALSQEDWDEVSDTPNLSDAEEAELQAEIANDPDNPELTDEELARLRPAREVLPPALYAALTRRGRPAAAHKRVQLTLRVDPDVLAAYKAGGPGWQTRMNAALAAGVGRGPGGPAKR